MKLYQLLKITKLQYYKLISSTPCEVLKYTDNNQSELTDYQSPGAPAFADSSSWLRAILCQMGPLSGTCLPATRQRLCLESRKIFPSPIQTRMYSRRE